MTPDEKSSLAEHMVKCHKVSHRQACKAVHLSSSTHRYQKKQGRDEPVIVQLNNLVDRHPAIGFLYTALLLVEEYFFWYRLNCFKNRLTKNLLHAP